MPGSRVERLRANCARLDGRGRPSLHERDTATLNPHSAIPNGKGRIAAALRVTDPVYELSSSASATAARAATTVTTRTAAGTATRTAATAAPTIAIAIATTAAGTSLTRAFGPRRARFYRRNHSIHTVEVRLIVRIEIRAAFDHRRGRAWL
jgi:hypothetical protein